MNTVKCNPTDAATDYCSSVFVNSKISRENKLFQSNLFTENIQEDSKINFLNLMVIKQHQRKFCETAETENELFLSIKSIKNNKSGNDDLTIESYEAAQDS